MPAVAHSRVLDGLFLLRGEEAPNASENAAGRTWEGNAVTVSSGHCTSQEKTTPRTGRDSWCGVSHIVVDIAPAGRLLRRSECERIKQLSDVGEELPTGLQVRWALSRAYM